MLDFDGETQTPADSSVASEVSISGVRHAGEILDLFTPLAPEWGVRSTARQLGISKSHAQRLLSSLACLGLLERQPSTRRYRVGVRSLVLASVLLESSPLISKALPIMRSLNERFALDVALSVWDRGGVVGLQPSADTLIVRREPGECVAVSTVLLAGRSDAEIDAVSEIGRRPVFAPGASTPDELRGRLDHVRAGGLIGDFRSVDGGGCQVAAPILDASGSVLAALSVEAARARWQVHKREFISGLSWAARRLTAYAAIG